MKSKQFIKLCLGIAKHPICTTQVLISKQKAITFDPVVSLRLGADWLLQAQDNAPDGNGYSRRYSLISGWDKCYIETTGYIIPTLLDVATYLGEDKYRESAIKAAEWLLSVQTVEGAFTDIDAYTPQVFDTGQVLLGLNRMFRETRDERYLTSLCKASQWLVDNQEADGSWVKFAYNNRPHAYYSRVAAALIEAGQLANIDEYVAAGIKNLEWVSQQRQTNGYFKYSEFRPSEDALLHTLVYVLEGFSMAYKLTGDQRWSSILINGTNDLAKLANEDGLLYSQYDSNWQATNTEYCVTGLAQYAGICFDAEDVTNNSDFHKRGEMVFKLLSQWQQTQGDNVTGALQSSVPLWGYYGSMDFYNWNIKFFIDASIKLSGKKTSIIEYDRKK